MVLAIASQVQRLFMLQAAAALLIMLPAAVLAVVVPAVEQVELQFGQMVQPGK
jgi:hypothetical protein